MKKKKEKNLTVFSPAPYGRWYIFHRVIWFFRCIDCAWQRATKGYCYRDLWSMDTFYVQLFVDTISEFRKHLHGSPCEFFDGDAENQIWKWEDYLKEMATHFYNSIEDNEVEKNEYDEKFFSLNPFRSKKDATGLLKSMKNDSPEAVELRDKWFKRDLEVNQWRHDELNKGLDMMKKVFENLWD